MLKQLRVFFLFLLTFLILGLSFSLGNAATKKISGTTNVQDTYLYAQNPNYQYGGKINLYISTNYGPIYSRVLIGVKNVASELGAGATNITAVCSLYVNDNTEDDTIYAYRVFKPWIEGILNGTTCTIEDEGATWADWNCLPLEWGTAGCNNASDAGSDNSSDGSGWDRKATAESYVNVTTVNHWYAWSISTELATGWYNGTIAERGIVLIGGTVGGYNAFNSTEYTTDPTKCPFFLFTYTPAGGASKSKLLLIREQKK